MSTDPELNASRQKLWILVPRAESQTIKTLLAANGILSSEESMVQNPRIVRQDFRILPQDGQEDHGKDTQLSPETAHVAIPTTLDCVVTDDDASILERLGLDHLTSVFPSTRCVLSESTALERKKPSSNQGNELTRAISQWYQNLPSSVRISLPSEGELLGSSTWRFTKYTPLLIFPSGTFSTEPWTRTFSTTSADEIQDLYRHIATSLAVTHIAEQAPIPLLTSSTSTNASESVSENILRSPLNLRPLYGNFGPVIRSTEPDEAAFRNSLWVTVRQHGIAQVFAPVYTMFANGNVNEKRRVRDLAELDLHESGLQRAAAADLYAGIGYFAFSYAKAGYRPVLCWELNAWSIEGFRRGAESNGWTCTTIEEDEELTDENIEKALESTFVVFHESNVYAKQRLDRLHGRISPIRHVNCGYLPSSQPSWHMALNLLDRDCGGWLHLHENCAIEDLESGLREKNLLSALISTEGANAGRRTSVEHVERVKSYAPGVLHCVFDVHVGPSLVELTVVAQPE